jgi:hypothetical protein
MFCHSSFYKENFRGIVLPIALFIMGLCALTSLHVLSMTLKAHQSVHRAYSQFQQKQQCIASNILD